VTFTKVEGGIKVVADIQGLTPGKMNHGAPMDMTRHAGDMGSLEADAAGKAHLEYIDQKLSFEGPGSIMGRSIIVHAKEDDLKTQPTGNAGPRVACGVIGIGK